MSRMTATKTPFRAIREALGATQTQIAEVIGRSQSNVTWYERAQEPQPVPEDVARRLIEHANRKGLPIDWNHVYGGAPLPERKVEQPAEQAQATASDQRSGEDRRHEDIGAPVARADDPPVERRNQARRQSDRPSAC